MQCIDSLQYSWTWTFIVNNSSMDFIVFNAKLCWIKPYKQYTMWDLLLLGENSRTMQFGFNIDGWMASVSHLYWADFGLICFISTYHFYVLLLHIMAPKKNIEHGYLSLRVGYQLDILGELRTSYSIYCSAWPKPKLSI